MNVELTRDGERMTATIYNAYLEKRKAGQSKNVAKMFSGRALKQEYFPGESQADFSDTLREVTRTFSCRMSIDGSFELSDSLIIYMENRFRNGIKDTASFLAQFIP
ncbi:MAG: hypothetical protein LUH03_09695 [Oscillospiraceae bacterium]|nr:hypothetical protein [Oscillospiraceae bacterium]